MITTGAISISEMLGKCSVQVVIMSYNNIGDDGITAIARALSNSQIRELYITHCGIGLTGVKSLGEGLLVNKSVRRIWMRVNPITVEGARLILEAAVNNGICQEVRIDNEYFSDNEVKKMNIILEERKKNEVGRLLCNVNDFCHFNSGYHNMRSRVEEYSSMYESSTMFAAYNYIHKNNLTTDNVPMINMF